tara:strand:- start:2241 stop:2624 length:384 start_codon:yes stop_codon:yes gene_type:complete
MKQRLSSILALGLSFLLIFTLSFKSMIRLSYEINKLEIIEKFCINKEEKSFQCDGKCHLATQLEQADSSEEEIPAEFRSEINLLLFGPLENESFGSNIESELEFIEAYTNLYAFLFSTTIEHPPKLV